MKWRETIRLKKNLFEKLTRKVRAEKIRHFGPKISRSPRDRIEAPKRRLLPRCPRISRVYYFSRNNIAGRRPMSRGKWHNFPLWSALYSIFYIPWSLLRDGHTSREHVSIKARATARGFFISPGKPQGHVARFSLLLPPGPTQKNLSLLIVELARFDRESFLYQNRGPH